MYEGLLEVNGVEIASIARSRAYVQAFMPSIRFDCDEQASEVIANEYHGALTSPAADAAPWYDAAVLESADFYGFFPASVQGGSDSTFSTPSTELIGEGAAFGFPRTASLETRWTLVGFAKDGAAMEVGMSWLKEALTGSAEGRSCDPLDFRVLKAPPRDPSNFYDLMRTYYNSAITVAPRVVEEMQSPSGIAWRVTFILTAGSPWGHTIADSVGSLSLATGYTTFTDPVGQNCSLQNAGYKDFINDPFYTAITLPPQPPAIKPSTLLPVPVWRRQVISLTSNLPERMRNQRIEVGLNIYANSEVRQLRMRIYRTTGSYADCNYVGEFYVSYLPAGSNLLIDSARRTAVVKLANGVETSGSHLLFGSDGNPFMWPDLKPKTPHVLVADLMPPFGETNTNVQIFISATAKD